MTFDKSKYKDASIEELNKAAARMHADRQANSEELAYVNSLRKAYFIAEQEAAPHGPPELTTNVSFGNTKVDK